MLTALSCDPIEPAKYTYSCYRVATVQEKDGKASLQLDYTSESYLYKNFSNVDHMRMFDVTKGERVIADITHQMTDGIMEKSTVNQLHKVKTLKLATNKPSDTLNFFYDFKPFKLADFEYPAIWTQGHILNLAPIYYAKNENSKVEFSLYPVSLNEDTLLFRMYSDIPSSAIKSATDNPYQNLLCFDIASLRDSLSDPAEHQHRKDIMNSLDNLSLEKIVIEVTLPDTMRTKVLRQDSLQEYLLRPTYSLCTTMNFDF